MGGWTESESSFEAGEWCGRKERARLSAFLYVGQPPLGCRPAKPKHRATASRAYRSSSAMPMTPSAPIPLMQPRQLSVFLCKRAPAVPPLPRLFLPELRTSIHRRHQSATEFLSRCITPHTPKDTLDVPLILASITLGPTAGGVPTHSPPARLYRLSDCDLGDAARRAPGSGNAPKKYSPDFHIFRNWR